MEGVLRGGVSHDPLSVFPIPVGDLGLGNQIHGDPQVPGIRGGDLGSPSSGLPATPVQQVSKSGFGCCLGMFDNPVSAPVGREDGRVTGSLCVCVCSFTWERGGTRKPEMSLGWCCGKLGALDSQQAPEIWRSPSSPWLGHKCMPPH